MRPMKWFLLLLLFFVLLLNLAFWHLFVSRYLEKRVERFEQELINRHYTEVEQLYRKMRGWKHDYHNHLQALKVCMSLREYGQAETYLSELDSSLSQLDQVVKTGNLMVDAILNSKLTLIRKQEIAVDCTASVPSEMNIKAIDLCVLIGNLLDNAMEACEAIPQKEQRFIRIYIDIVKGQLYLCITNSMLGRARKKGDFYPTAKDGSHGFGLGRIDHTVRSYNGYLSRQSEEGVFSTEIMLPLS